MPISNLMPGSLYRDQVSIRLILEPRLGIIALPDDGTKATARLLMVSKPWLDCCWLHQYLVSQPGQRSSCGRTQQMPTSRGDPNLRGDIYMKWKLVWWEIHTQLNLPLTHRLTLDRWPRRHCRQHSLKVESFHRFLLLASDLDSKLEEPKEHWKQCQLCHTVCVTFVLSCDTSRKILLSIVSRPRWSKIAFALNCVNCDEAKIFLSHLDEVSSL